MARGSHSELVEHLTAAAQRGLVTDRDVAPALADATRARAACTRFILYLESARAPGCD